MKNKLRKSMMVISIIIIPILFSCASAQQKQNEPKDAKFYFNRGIAYGEKGQFDQAIADFTKALEIGPRYAGAYYFRGTAYESKRQYDQAISDYTKALEIEPNYVISYYRRGYLYYIQKEYDKSWEDIKKAQAIGYIIPPEFLDELRKASGRQN